MQEQVSVPEPVCLASPSSSEMESYHCYEQLGRFLWESQAEIVSDDTVNDAQETKEGLITFMERKEVDTVGMYTKSVATDSTTNTHLAEFLKRPVKIDSFLWAESDVGARRNINPWSLWATTTSVQNKLSNYAFFRGDLHIKVQISASPFYYGMMLVNYRPWTSCKPDTIYHGSDNSWKVPQSQRPHFKLDPTVSDTYEMILPFIVPFNMVTIQSAAEFTNMGNLRFDIYSVLRSANGVTNSGVTVTTYAWIDNLKLSGASAGFAAQSDEYGEGCVSKPASWVADIAGRLEDVPIIGAFATATRIGASAVSAIASMFGFTNVPVISDTQPMRPEPFPKFASCEIGYPIEKLTLDPKNELSVDPRIFGLNSGLDELSIPSVVQRESFLCSQSWSTANSADDVLFTALVEPGLCDKVAITGATVLQHTPMSWLAECFKYWRGDIIFTVRVIASKYHKGKIKISFDPSGYGTGNNNILTNPNTANVVQTAVLDIGECREMEFTVPYQQATQFLEVHRRSSNWGTSTSLSHNANADNGYFCIRVQNVLTAPVASSTVDILIFIRAGDNFEYAFPEEIDPDHVLSYFGPQSEDYISAPVNGKIKLGDVSQDTKNQYLIYFGEQVVSLRQLLHRTCRLSQEISLASTTANTFQDTRKVVARLPMTPGYNQWGYYTANKQATGTYNYNFVEFTPIAYIANAYVGYRGSIHYSFNVTSSSEVKNIRTYRDQTNQVAFNNEADVFTSTGQFARANLDRAGTRGMSVTNQLTQAGVSVSFPFFNNAKFLATDPDLGNKPDKVMSDYDMLVMKADYDYPVAANANMIVTTYVAAGPDFSLFYFLNAPSVYQYNSVPTAP